MRVECLHFLLCPSRLLQFPLSIGFTLRKHNLKRGYHTHVIASAAKQSCYSIAYSDCFVVSLLAMTGESTSMHSYLPRHYDLCKR